MTCQRDQFHGVTSAMHGHLQHGIDSFSPGASLRQAKALPNRIPSDSNHVVGDRNYAANCHNLTATAEFVDFSGKDAVPRDAHLKPLGGKAEASMHATKTKQAKLCMSDQLGWIKF